MRPSGGLLVGSNAALALLSAIAIIVFVWTNEKIIQNRMLQAAADLEVLDSVDAEVARLVVAENKRAGEAPTVQAPERLVDVFITAAGQMVHKCPKPVQTVDPVSGRAASTLVLYVYNAADEEQVANFRYFVDFGIDTTSGATYRVLVTRGAGILPPPDPLPGLPAGAEYVEITPPCTGTWGVLGEVERHVRVAEYKYLVVVDSSVRGPFLPAYAAAAMHWTEALTGRLQDAVKMVGSVISCEGAPLGGHAALDWRVNPHILRYAWATDAAGWALLRGDSNVLRCYDSPWDARYYSDLGASLAILRAGYNLDTLLTRYQGVDWWNKGNWQCNARVSPDVELAYDGASITPLETMFVPMDAGRRDGSWSFTRAAERYETWARARRAAKGAADVSSNAWTAEPWAVRAAGLVAMNARGPGCFDFRFYVKNNADLHARSASPLDLWEHWLLVGQFQGRPHRFSCPVQLGTTYRIAYLRARGGTCFDHNYYLRKNPDLRAAGMSTPAELFGHYTYFGQFEERPVRFLCPDTWHDLAGGFEAVPVGNETEVEAALRAVKAATLEGRGLVRADAGDVALAAGALHGGGGNVAADAGGAGQAGGAAAQTTTAQAAATATETTTQTATATTQQAEGATGGAAAAAAQGQAQAAGAVNAEQQQQAQVTATEQQQAAGDAATMGNVGEVQAAAGQVAAGQA